MFPSWRRMRPLKTGVMLSVLRPPNMHACWEGGEGCFLVKNSEKEGPPRIRYPPFSSSLISIMQFWVIPFQERKGGRHGIQSASQHRPVCPARRGRGGRGRRGGEACPACPPASRTVVSRVTKPYPAYKDHHATAAWSRLLYQVVAQNVAQVTEYRALWAAQLD